MAPTESAREARKAFHCDLCQKGYSRINELEAHQSSYDHTHRQRLKDLKSITRASDPTFSARARRAEEKASAHDVVGGGMMPISLSGAGSRGGGEKKKGFKKGAFRNAFSATAAVVGGGGGGSGEERAKDIGASIKENNANRTDSHDDKNNNNYNDDDDDDDNNLQWGDYDPKQPTGCGEWCAGHQDST